MATPRAVHSFRVRNRHRGCQLIQAAWNQRLAHTTLRDRFDRYDGVFGKPALTRISWKLVLNWVRFYGQKKRETCMKGFAVVLMGAALCVAQPVFAQMGSPDAKPEPGMPGVAGARAGEDRAGAGGHLEGV